MWQARADIGFFEGSFGLSLRMRASYLGLIALVTITPQRLSKLTILSTGDWHHRYSGMQFSIIFLRGAYIVWMWKT